MTISNLLAPIPKWIIIRDDGTTAGGAKMYTKSSLNKSQNKKVYQDAGGTIEWTNPIIFDANGTQGPFYWTVDSTNLLDTYFIEVFDSDDTLLFTIDDYAPPGSGGGGSSQTFIDSKNLVINGLFWRYFNSDQNVSSETNLIIAPGAHARLPEVSSSTGGATGHDIRFIKSNTSSTDRIRFDNFAQGDNPFSGDVTPPWSLRFTCTAAGTETYKYIQIPICQNVQSINQQEITLIIWAKTGVGSHDIDLNIRQFYGTSGGAADVNTSVTCNVTTTWTRFVKTLTIPVANGAIGACGNDAVYLQIRYPTEELDLYIAKPQLYLGNIEGPDPTTDTFDEIDAFINSPRTGDIKTSFNNRVPLGYLAMNNQSIGSASSGATNRANIDTFSLYREIYLGVSDTWAPVATGRTAPGNTIASCIADFVANKALTLTRQLGRVITCNNPDFTASLTFTADFTTDTLTVSSTANLPTGTPVLVSNSGGSLPSPLQANTVYYVQNTGATTLKLAQSVDFAESLIAIDLTNNGAGVQTLLPALGVYFGEGRHLLTVNELVDHQHGSPAGTNFQTTGGAGGVTTLGLGQSQSSITGLVTGKTATETFTIMQPSVYQNVFIKL